MEITDIRIRQVTADGKLKAYVTVTFDDCFVVHNVKIIEGKNGAFIAMPSRKTKTGEYKDVAHPINSTFRGLLQERILEEYQKAKENQPPPSDAAADEDLETEDQEEQ
jgi:stage V sporulation protein G